MTSPPTDVLACVDFSPTAAAVVDAAAQLAQGMQARLHILHAAAPEPEFVGYDEPGGPEDRDRRADELRDEHARLQELVQRVADDELEVRPLLVMGATVDVVLAEAERHDSALIVVGSHGHRALHRVLVGSTTDKLLRRSARPVVVVPAVDRT